VEYVAAGEAGEGRVMSGRAVSAEGVGRGVAEVTVREG